jgi:type II secretory pathway pseudopilin PulG
MKPYLRQQFKIPQASAGQTMIETLVAIFMLTMGVSAALGLAIFAFSSSTNIAKQIIATGLAREGLEAVKNMRDTNWLQQTSINTNCWNYVSNDLTASCYKNWLNQQYCLDPKNNNGHGNCNGNNSIQSDYFLGFDSAANGYWVLEPQRNCGSNCNYGLWLDKTNQNGYGFYYPGTKTGSNWNGVVCDNNANMSDYCRKITITEDPNPAPYNQATEGPLLKVQSFVWWVDKKCPRAADWPQASPTCRLELDMYLTNWKNY